MNLEKIKCFVDIVKYNSFTKAAQENYITQAAISQQIASMEAELGFPLFVRSKRGFTVTDSGKSFYESSLRLLALYSRFAFPVPGALRITFPDIFPWESGRAWIPPTPTA